MKKLNVKKLNKFYKSDAYTYDLKTLVTSAVTNYTDSKTTSNGITLYELNEVYYNVLLDLHLLEDITN